MRRSRHRTSFAWMLLTAVAALGACGSAEPESSTTREEPAEAPDADEAVADLRERPEPASSATLSALLPLNGQLEPRGAPVEFICESRCGLDELLMHQTYLDARAEPEVDCGAPCPIERVSGLYRIVRRGEALVRRLDGAETLGAALVSREPRRLDPRPVEGPGVPTIAAGRGLVGFTLHTGGDQGSLVSVEGGLVVFARWATGSLRQQIASCSAAGYGEPPPHEGTFEAACDRRTIELRLSGSTLTVHDGDAQLSAITLPRGVVFTIAG